MAAFPEVQKIQYEGPQSRNPLAFRWYNEQERVEGKTMRDHFRFSVVYWHTFRGTGSDPFGAGTMLRPWDDGSNSVENAIRRVRAAFEFIEKLGAPYYAFHDRDVAPEGESLAETNRNFDAVAKVLREEQQRTGVKLLWGTANMFSHPRYMAPRQHATPTCSLSPRPRSRSAWKSPRSSAAKIMSSGEDAKGTRICSIPT
jgi:xylose isomerase